ncbi:MAG: amino acid ABC transporter substrate-binding protein [Ruminococcaceae bacterium]|nr:amino acid ABC transporter substrate-binding protein [Oscillospiraceae bacterium]
MFKKMMAAIVALLMVLTCFVGCSGDASEHAVSLDGLYTPEGWTEEKGTLTIGLDDTFAPMGFRDTEGYLVGFDIDLAVAVGDELGMQVKFQPIDWNSKEVELDSGRIDCIWNGMSATTERQEIMQLTNQYLNNRIVVMVKKGVSVNTVEELAALNIGTQAGSASFEVMEAHEKFADFSAKIQTYDTYDEVIMALDAGRVDCMVVDEVLGSYKNNQAGNPYEVAAFNFGDDYYAIGCKKGNTELVDKLNNAIKTLIDNGEAAEISNKWFGKNVVIFEGYGE